jgi:hypothetical protein
MTHSASYTACSLSIRVISEHLFGGMLLLQRSMEGSAIVYNAFSLICIFEERQGSF